MYPRCLIIGRPCGRAVHSCAVTTTRPTSAARTLDPTPASPCRGCGQGSDVCGRARCEARPQRTGGAVRGEARRCRAGHSCAETQHPVGDVLDPTVVSRDRVWCRGAGLRWRGGDGKRAVGCAWAAPRFKRNGVVNGSSSLMSSSTLLSVRGISSSRLLSSMFFCFRPG